jgi:ubiquinone/menaquinone biosynthesis C-methylase UbiE
MTNTDGWKSKETANHYLSLADVLIPYRNEILDIIATLAVDNYRPGTKIIDLGCGNGELTECILKKNSQPQIIMVDYSEVMIEPQLSEKSGCFLEIGMG